MSEEGEMKASKLTAKVKITIRISKGRKETEEEKKMYCHRQDWQMEKYDDNASRISSPLFLREE